jgi:hypothetical protein
MSCKTLKDKFHARLFLFCICVLLASAMIQVLLTLHGPIPDLWLGVGVYTLALVAGQWVIVSCLKLADMFVVEHKRESDLQKDFINQLHHSHGVSLMAYQQEIRRLTALAASAQQEASKPDRRLRAKARNRANTIRRLYLQLYGTAYCPECGRKAIRVSPQLRGHIKHKFVCSNMAHWQGDDPDMRWLPPNTEEPTQ